MRNATIVAAPPFARAVGSGAGAEPSALDAPPTFYINRDCDGDRRENIERQLQKAGLAAERISGVNGLAVPDDMRDYFFENGKLCSALKPGEVGCYASHLVALQTLVARGLDYALVLEDDAILPPDLTHIVRTVLATAPSTWDYIHLSGDVQRAFKPVASLGTTGKLVRYSRIPGVTVGYLISRRGAEKFLTPSRRIWPVDTDFRRPWIFNLDTFGVYPKIIGHNEDPNSPIQLLGGRARQRRGLPRPSRDCWTGNPLHTLDGAFHNIRSLGLDWWALCCWRNIRRKLFRSKARTPQTSGATLAMKSSVS